MIYHFLSLLSAQTISASTCPASGAHLYRARRSTRLDMTHACSPLIDVSMSRLRLQQNILPKPKGQSMTALFRPTSNSVTVTSLELNHEITVPSHRHYLSSLPLPTHNNNICSAIMNFSTIWPLSHLLDIWFLLVLLVRLSLRPVPDPVVVRRTLPQRCRRRRY